MIPANGSETKCEGQLDKATNDVKSKLSRHTNLGGRFGKRAIPSERVPDLCGKKA